MNKKLLSILGMSLLVLASCNKEDNNSGIVDVDGKSEIQMTAGVTSVGTKGPINSNFNTNFPIGIYAKDGAWTPGSTNWINDAAGTVLGFGAHAILFSGGPYYYPTDGSTLDFYAFAPFALESTPAGAGVSPKVSYTITGDEDVMWAKGTGYKPSSGPAHHPVLDFEHKLTQLNFELKSGLGYPTSGNKVVSIKVRNQPTTVVMTVQTGHCAFSGSADMQALSPAEMITGFEITGAGNCIDAPVMTQPKLGILGYHTYSLDIEVKPSSGPNVTYTNVPVDVIAAEGYANKICIVFNGSIICATACVDDWRNGLGGIAIVD